MVDVYQVCMQIDRYTSWYLEFALFDSFEPQKEYSLLYLLWGSVAAILFSIFLPIKILSIFKFKKKEDNSEVTI